MYNERLEKLIDAALADGELTEKEKMVLYKNAQALGIDLDEFEMVLDARLYEKQKELNLEKAEEKAEKKAEAQPQKTSVEKLNELLRKITDECQQKKYSLSWEEKLFGPSEDKKRSEEMDMLKREAITSFPVPDKKEDLLEFALSMQTGKKTSYDFEEEYSAKFNECISKIKQKFPNDPMFKTLVPGQKKGFLGKLFGK